jgi:hypothetical protein
MSYTSKRTAKHAVLPWAAYAAAAALSVLAAPSASAQAQAQRIAIDPETGRARAPELDEMPAAARGAARAAVAPGAARAAVAPGAARAGAPADERARPVAGTRFGAKGFRVDPSRMSFTVVRRNADGSISTQCVANESAAEHALHGAVAGGAHDH